MQNVSNCTHLKLGVTGLDGQANITGQDARPVCKPEIKAEKVRRSCTSREGQTKSWVMALTTALPPGSTSTHWHQSKAEETRPSRNFRPPFCGAQNSKGGIGCSLACWHIVTSEAQEKDCHTSSSFSHIYG